MIGIAPHSLRAVTPAELAEVTRLAPDGPIHINIAEQVKEVEDCVAWSGKRPVEWLLENADVDERWCLIHCTHADEDEIRRLAASGAVAGLCPVTEANLGDGIFPGVAYRAQGGRIGIGTDSHVSPSVVEELRWLEYGQRLRDERRNRLADGPHRSVGRDLYAAALEGGAQALGQPVGAIARGHVASLVVLDGRDAFIDTAREDAILDRWLFALGDRTDGGQQLGRPDILQQEPAGTRPQPAERVFIEIEGGEDDDPAVRVPLHDGAGGRDAVESGHPHIHEHDVGTVLHGQTDR